MAVQEQTPYIEHTGNGVTTSFSLEFQCESKGHLIVLVDEIEPPIATWSLTGGNVVFTTAPAAGKKITLQRNTPFSRTTDYQSFNNSFRPQTVNSDVDRIWLKLQELGYKDSVLLRMVVQEITERKLKDTEINAKLAAEAAARILADKNLQNQLDQDNADIYDLFKKLSNEIVNRISGDKSVRKDLTDYINFMLTQESEDMPIFTGVADNIVITEDGGTQRELNRISTITVSTVAEMLLLTSWPGRTVVTRGYYNPDNYTLLNPYKGGGTYVYNPEKSNVNNGVTVINGWTLQIENTINVHQCGLLCNGTTDETVLIKKALLACKELALIKNNDVVVIDGLDTYIKISDSIEIDLALVGLKNLFFLISDTFKPMSFKAAINAITSDSWSDIPFTHRKSLGMTLENVQIEGTEKISELAAIKFSPHYAVTFHRIQINSLRTGNTKYGIVFDENCFLMTFNNYQCFNHDIPLTDMFSLGLASKFGNMGENIRFIAGVIANSNRVMLNLQGWDCNFIGVSFDYCGGKQNEKFVQFKIGNSPNIKLHQCHIESGNDNAGITDFMFEADYRALIVISKSTILLSGNYNNCPEFFHDANTENDKRAGPEFIIDDTWCYAPSVKTWANKGLSKFKAWYNSPNSGVNRLMTDAHRYLIDPFFSSNFVPDMWSVGETSEKTSRLKNADQEISVVSITDNSGNSINCLKITQTVGPGATRKVKLFIPRNLNQHIGCLDFVVKFKNILEANIFVNAILVKSMNKFDEFGVPVSYFELPYASVSISPSSENTNFNRFGFLTSQIKREDIVKFDYMLLELNTYGLSSTNEMYISEIYCDQPD